jgi:hypothetical protein
MIASPTIASEGFAPLRRRADSRLARSAIRPEEAMNPPRRFIGAFRAALRPPRPPQPAGLRALNPATSRAVDPLTAFAQAGPLCLIYYTTLFVA